MTRIASEKKSDAMISTYQTGTGVITPTVGAKTFTGTYDSLFLVSARVPFSLNPVAKDHMRMSSTTFCRGAAERMRIEVSDGVDLTWRRIVFLFKGNPFKSNDPTGTGGQPYYIDTTNAVTRWFNQMSAIQTSLLQQTLFQGEFSVDWVNVFLAPVDTDRITVLSDRTRILRAVNGSAHSHIMRQWIGVNRTLIYDDQEEAKTVTPKVTSSPSNKSCGDVYIYDIFNCDSESSIEADMRYYWHEH